MIPEKSLESLSSDEKKKAAIAKINSYKLEKVKLLRNLDDKAIEDTFDALIVEIEQLRWWHTLVATECGKRNIKVKNPWAKPSAEDRKSYKVKPESDKSKTTRKRKAKLDPAQKLFVSLMQTPTYKNMENGKEAAKEAVEKTGMKLTFPEGW